MRAYFTLTGACPKCGNALRRRESHRGPFIGCDAYPECRWTAEYDKALQQLGEDLVQAEHGRRRIDDPLGLVNKIMELETENTRLKQAEQAAREAWQESISALNEINAEIAEIIGINGEHEGCVREQERLRAELTAAQQRIKQLQKLEKPEAPQAVEAPPRFTLLEVDE